MASAAPYHFIYFISSHGFGHAARAAAVIAAVKRLIPGSHFTVFTTVPAWFFDSSLDTTVDLISLDADLGLVQTDALTEDLPATLRELDRRIPFPESMLDGLARRLDELGAAVVVCDIAPLGLAVARRCGVPSVLVENFTWDWIYRGYLDECPGLEPLAAYLEEAFAEATYRVQTEPVCSPSADAIQVAPVSRKPREQRAHVRRRLGVPDDAPLAVVSMGGVGWSYDTLATGPDGHAVWVVVFGSQTTLRDRRVIRLPHHSEFYHPDLIHAADVVVGKLGYSTLAEVWSAGVRLGYVTRQHFRESPMLEAWAQRELTCRRLEASALENGEWLDTVAELLQAPRGRADRAGGADEVGQFLVEVASLLP
jgi:hypothetical protein